MIESYWKDEEFSLPQGSSLDSLCVRIFSVPLYSMSDEQIRSHINDLNNKKERIGIVRFPGINPSGRVVIIFSGYAESFYTLWVAREIRHEVIYIQDPYNSWFQGSKLLPSLHEFVPHLIATFVDARDVTIFGQSSGGYAALIASTYFKGAKVIACSPQTFCDRDIKSMILSGNIRVARTPVNIEDVRKYIDTKSDSKARYIVLCAASESEDMPEKHVWLDLIHFSRLVGMQNTTCQLVNFHRHGIVAKKSAVYSAFIESIAGLVDTEEHNIKNLVKELARTYE